MSTGLFGALDTSASGLTATRLWMDVIANNLANADTTRTASGGPYQREELVLQERGASPGGPLAASDASFGGFAVDQGAAGVQVSGIVADPTPPHLVYDPGNPDANAKGYVAMPNVNSVTEMVDMITATRAYEANVTAITAVKGEAQHALDVLR